jgi:ATP-binding protein involved in chromosome partitioning
MDLEKARTTLGNIEAKAGKDVLAAGVVQNLIVEAEQIRMELVYDDTFGMQDRASIEAGIRTAFKMSGWDKKLTLTPIMKMKPVASPEGPKGGNVGPVVGIGGRKAPGPQGPGPQGPPGPPGHTQQRQGNVAPSGKKEIPGVKYVVAVASGKGGVGKSTVASNLAVALAKLGHKVGLLDNDVYGPSLPILFAVLGEKPAVSPERKLIPLQKYGIKLMSLGFLLEEDAPAIWRGPIVMQVTDQLMFDTAWGELDFLILDLPPGTGDVQLTLAQKAPLTAAIIVSTPQDIALADATRGLHMFNRVDVPVMGIVENMSYFACPKCGHESHIFSHGGAKEKAKELGVDFLGEIPLDMETRQAGDIGRPIVVSNPDSPVSREFLALAARVAERCDRISGGATLAARMKAGLFKIIN